MRDAAHVRAGVGGNDLAFDRVEGPERLAQREGDAGADLEDREMVADQRGERPRGLVVGRVRLEDDPFHTLDRRADSAVAFSER